MPVTYSSVRERLKAIRSALSDNPDDAQEFTVREVVSWFGFQRRTRSHVRKIRTALRNERLRTVPDFNAAHIDSTIAFELRDSAGTGRPVTTEQTGTDPGLPSTPRYTSPEASETEQEDEEDVVRAARVSRLLLESRGVVSVKPDDTLAEATTKMLARDYSQLPVMINERSVKGMVSWESIGKRLSLGVDVKYVRECTVEAKEVRADSLLFEVVETVIESEAVLVRGDDQRIVGILTTADLSREFQILGEPFLRIGEIKNHLRGLLKVLPTEEIAGAADPGDSKEVESASDLSFGEVLRLIAPRRMGQAGTSSGSHIPPQRPRTGSHHPKRCNALRPRRLG